MKEAEKSGERIIKAVLLGNSGVGKTNLINTCIGQQFNAESAVTTSGSFSQKDIIIKDKIYHVQLWDTAGQELYDSITKILLKKSEIVIFVYDITDKESFISLEKWIGICKDTIDNTYTSGIVGNKLDLFIKEQVNEQQAREYAESKGMQFQLVSAKDNPQGFQLFLKELVEELEGISRNDTTENISLNQINFGEKKKKCNC